MKNINTLPIDCLIGIFSKIPLQQQIPLRVVCTHWKVTIESMVQKRTSLKLFGRLKNITDFCLTAICDNTRESLGESFALKRAGKDDDLLVDSFIFCDSTEMYSDFLLRLFSHHLRQLSVHFCWDSPWSHLELLLINCHALTSLTLTGAIDYPHTDFTHRLCSALNALPSLKRLDLLVIDLFIIENGKENSAMEIEMPDLFDNLEHFSIANYKGDLVGVLEQLNPDICTSLRLDLPRDCDAIELMEDLVEDCPTLLANLTSFRLSLPDLHDVNQLMRFLCTHFRSLRCLDLQCCSFINFEVLKIDCTFINQINCLEGLTELRLSHVGINLNLLLEKSYLLPRMPHIKVLHLSQVSTCPRESTSLYVQTSTDPQLWEIINEIFPCLEEIHIRVKKASTGAIEENLKQYGRHLKRIDVYSPEDVIPHFFGYHRRFDCSKSKGGKFFSQCFFDRINDL